MSGVWWLRIGIAAPAAATTTVTAGMGPADDAFGGDRVAAAQVEQRRLGVAADGQRRLPTSTATTALAAAPTIGALTRSVLTGIGER